MNLPFDDAKKAMEKAIERAQDVGQDYAEQWHREILTPFCERHSLRFWSGNGTWFFASPTGMYVDVEVLVHRWCISTGNAEFIPARNQYEDNRWARRIHENDLPEFYQELQAIEDMLSADFLGGCFGFWVDDCRTDVPDIGNLAFHEKIRKT